ncbi:heterodisulfide reductase-related iron-sulfur binding cluster [soil metagenome]
MIRELTADCVHCGFCLPTCPTYVLWNEEMDSPRGRIHLMDARLDEAVTLNDTVTTHFDRCLGCMACLSSCPSGVRYDRLIEATRAAVEEEYDRPLGDRVLRGLLFRVLPYPGRMRVALALAPLGKSVPLPRRFRPLVEVAPPWRGRGEVAGTTHSVGVRRGRVGLLTGCVQRAVFSDVNAATARVLAADGYEVAAPPQGCCGALSIHAGRAEEGKAFARKLIAAFDDVEVVVVNSSGCGSHLKELGWLLGDERAADFATKVRDVGEFLAGVRPQARRHPLPLKVALQDSCHLRHAQGLPLASLGALGRIPALDVVEPAEQDLCCGSAGIYNVVQPEAARELGDRKAGHVLATGAQAYASANPGCLVQVSQALRRVRRPLPALHPIELVDASIRNVGAGRLLSRARR